MAIGCAAVLGAALGVWEWFEHTSRTVEAAAFGGFFYGEVVALVMALTIAFQVRTWTAALHVGISSVWIWTLWTFGPHAWHFIWAAAGLPTS